MQLIAKTFYGLEDILSKEIAGLGGTEILKLNRAVSFEGDLDLLYEANLRLRTALSILVPIYKFKVTGEKDLYEAISEINWIDYMSLQETFAINSVVNSPFFNHSKYVALKAKDAIVDQFRKNTGDRPSINTTNPDLRINIHITNNQATLSLDSSGDSLHKRGYRKGRHAAPINEVLGAGLLLLAGFDGSKPFLDPMCGSGTILIEAAMIAHNIAPGKYREKFGFQNWRNYDERLWAKIRSKVLGQEKEAACRIVGSDISINAIKSARINLAAAGFEDVLLSRKSFYDQKPSFENGVVVTNPPYGERLEVDDVIRLYKKIGDQFKQYYPGFEAWVLSSNIEALKHLGLKTFKKYIVFNGALECRYHGYQLYKGSKKAKKQV